jgi:broad specificity phosphatase PhoE
MRKRASEFIHSLLPKHLKDTVLIVWHAGINRFLTSAVLGEDVVTAFWNTSVSIYEVADDFTVKTEVFNCMKHLED